MRDLVIFIILLVVIFFGVGEWRGWYLGNPPQTPMFVYKKDYTFEKEWDFLRMNHFPFNYEGKVRRGSVTVEVYYERKRSTQNPNDPVVPKRLIYQENFGQGQTINITEDFTQGLGQYSAVIAFSDASGTFNMEIPSANARIGGN